MHRLQAVRLVAAAVLAVGAGVGISVVVCGASPATGTLSSSGGPVTWDGPATAGASPDGEATCIEGTNCDTFTLRIAPAITPAHACAFG